MKRKRSPKREWKQRGKSNHQPETLDARRWSWTTLRRKVQRRDALKRWNPGFQTKTLAQICPKIKSSACNRFEIWPKSLWEAGMWRGGKLWRRKWDKWSARGGVLNSQPWQTGQPIPQPVDRLVNDQRSIFPNFLAFSCLMILSLPFLVEIPNFLCLMPWEFWFLVKIWPLSYDYFYMMHMIWISRNHMIYSKAISTRIHQAIIWS